MSGSTGNDEGLDRGSDEQEALLRALRAPGAPEELADEERYRAMFRASATSGDAATEAPVVALRSRTPRRLVVAGSAAVALAVATGGVAAAYTGSLPDPIQRIAHQVIGAPPSSPDPTPAQAAGTPTPRRSTAPRPTGSASPTPRQQVTTRPSKAPSKRPSATATATAAVTAGPLPTSATAGVSPTPTPSPSLTPIPSPTATPSPVVTGLTILGSSHVADVGARLVFSGQVTSVGAAPVAKQKVVLQQLFGKHWAFVASARSDATGEVSLSALPLQRTSSFRLRVADVRSAVWRVALHPLLTLSTSTQDRRVTILVSAAGARPGDLVTLAARGDGAPTPVDRARLAVDGTVTFTVAPQATRTRYTVLLAPTGRHTAARATVSVPKAKGAGR